MRTIHISCNQLTFPAKELDAPILVPVDLGRVVGRRNRIRGGPHLAIGHGQRKLRTVGTGRNQSVRLGILVSGLEPVKVPVADAPPLDLAGVDGLVDPFRNLVMCTILIYISFNNTLLHI